MTSVIQALSLYPPAERVYLFNKIFIQGEMQFKRPKRLRGNPCLIKVTFIENSHLTASILFLTGRTGFSREAPNIYRLLRTSGNMLFLFVPRGLLSAASVAFLPSPQWLWSKGRHCSPVPATTSRLRDGSLGWPRFLTRYTLRLVVSDTYRTSPIGSMAR